MSQQVHVGELLPAYALGCLENDDEIRVSEHLAICSACRTELLEYESVTGQLAFGAPTAAPSADLRQRLMERVRPTPAAPAAETQLSWWDKLTGLWQRAAPAWGAVSLVLIMVLAIGNLMLWQELKEPKTKPGGMQVITLSSTQAAPGALGTLVISTDGEHGSLIVDGLPVLDDAHQYQLWLIRDEKRTDGGVFSVNPEGYGALWIESEAPLVSYPAFGVTVEPAGGSPGPTGQKVLGGSF